MAENLQEFETPDAAGKAAEALESYQDKTDDLVGENSLLTWARLTQPPMEFLG